MASKKNPQTMAKRVREQAVKERRDRKRERKAEAAAARLAAEQETATAGPDDGSAAPDPEAPVEE
jgi:hypothetical protein